MRNKLNEVKEFSEIVDIISRCDTIRIAMFDDSYPYIVPVNFGEEIIGDQVVFYIHTGYEGKKNDLLAKNPNIVFEMDCNHELYYRESNMSCNFRYESVVGTGRVEILPEEEKEKALTLLMNHYHPESVKFNPKFVHMTQCMKIIVNDITAKERYTGLQDNAISGRSKKSTHVKEEKIVKEYQPDSRDRKCSTDSWNLCTESRKCFRGFQIRVESAKKYGSRMELWSKQCSDIYH